MYKDGNLLVVILLEFNSQYRSNGDKLSIIGCVLQRRDHSEPHLSISVPYLRVRY